LIEFAAETNFVSGSGKEMEQAKLVGVLAIDSNELRSEIVCLLFILGIIAVHLISYFACVFARVCVRA